MPPLQTTLLVLAILFLSTLIRSTLGFGDALIGMPLLALLVGVQAATPLVALAASTIALTILLGSWRQADFRATWQLILSTLAGIPVGLWLLRSAPEGLILGGLGALLALFGLYNLFAPRLPTLRSGWAGYACGFFAGILGGAYNTNGPPIVIYGELQGWSPERFRSTLQGYFFPTGLLILAGHGLAGLWTPTVIRLYLLALPLIVATALLGGRISNRIPQEQFKKLVNVALVVFGIILLL